VRATCLSLGRQVAVGAKTSINPGAPGKLGAVPCCGVPTPIEIALVNASCLADEDVAQGMTALQKQVSEDFAPVWHIDAELQMVPRDEAFRPVKYPDHWALVLLDRGLVGERLGPGRLRGYHDLTSAGQPLARVLVDQLEPGQDWTHVASHELLEMLADPDCNRSVFRHPDTDTLLFYAQEVCDPCAAYADGYEKSGRTVSDFVFPTWFQPAACDRGVTRFDECGLIDEPFRLRPGGYIGVFRPAAMTWTLETSGEAGEEENQVGGRLERRGTADNRWLDSDMSLSP